MLDFQPVGVEMTNCLEIFIRLYIRDKVNVARNFPGTGYWVHCSFFVPATTKTGSLVAISPACLSSAGRGQLRAEKV